MKPSTLLLSLCLGLFTTAAWAALKPGDAAPAFNIPVVGAAFANRISYGKILYAYSDSNAEKHIENALAVVRKWRDEHKR